MHFLNSFKRFCIAPQGFSFPTSDEQGGWALLTSEEDWEQVSGSQYFTMWRCQTASLLPVYFILILLLWFNHFLETLEVNNKSGGQFSQGFTKFTNGHAVSQKQSSLNVSSLLSSDYIFYPPGDLMVQNGCWNLAIMSANQAVGRRKRGMARGCPIFRATG